jgi:hypothetical protein
MTNVQFIVIICKVQNFYMYMYHTCEFPECASDDYKHVERY